MNSTAIIIEILVMFAVFTFLTIFLQGVGYAYFLIFILFAYDTFFLDWVVFANMKSLRLPGTEHMDREYHQKWFHVKACLPMIPVFAVMGLLISWVMTLIW